MPTITGTLETILGSEAVDGTIEVALCGYGSRVPRMNGQALAARITDSAVTVDVDGTFEFEVTGNDQIAPAGTYYTVTVKDDNGDTVQVNAYQFLSTTPTYDLNLIDPYDPNQPPPPLPPLLSNNLDLVAGDVDAHFDGGTVTSWKIILTQDVNQAYLTNILPGNLYTFIIVQDAAGGHFFQWPSGPPPAGLHNGPYINQAPNATTIQTFVADENSQMYPIGPATYFP